MAAIFLSGDLLFASKVAAAALRQGVMVETARTPAAVFAKAIGRPLELVIVDLGLPGLDLPALVRDIRALPEQPRAILAFGPHVHDRLLDAARDAGCDIVITRGQFHAQLDELLGHFLARTGSAES